MQPNNNSQQPLTDKLTDKQYIEISAKYGGQNMIRIADILRLYKQRPDEAKRFFHSLKMPLLVQAVEEIEQTIKDNESKD